MVIWLLAPMKSIRKTLTKRLSVIISLLVITVLLAADIGVDSWVEREFNQGMRAKVGMLQSLVNEEVEGVEFEFAGEYLPEFEGTSSPEYFQLWLGDDVFEKSDTLAFHDIKQLPLTVPELNTTIISDITLPDGRSGRIIYSKFIPQIDTEDRTQYFKIKGEDERTPMIIAYATSVEQLNFTLWFIDAAFVFALIVVPLAVRFAVRNTVAYALAPLDALNVKIRGLSFTDHQQREIFDTDIEELVPIAESLNHFIKDNYSLYLREKRLTSDIAHELKTPVAELISMAEVSMKFPGDVRLEENFKPNVLQIGTRMKNIISGLMLFQKYSFKKLDLEDDIDLLPLFNQIIKDKDLLTLKIHCEHHDSLKLKSNLVAVESIISNLIDNAVKHGKRDSEIHISLNNSADSKPYFEILNSVDQEVSDSDLSHMFEPLWQQDASRTSEEHFGLGLSIVRAMCEAINAQITVSKPSHDKIAFKVTFGVPTATRTQI